MDSIHLIVVAGSETGKGVRVDPGSEVTIGRDATNELVLHDQAVSRCHGRIVIGGDGIFLEDLGSSNGIEVNGAAIDGRARIRPGDTVRIGGQTIQVALGGVEGGPPLAGDFGLFEEGRQTDQTAVLPAMPRPQDFADLDLGTLRTGQPIASDGESHLISGEDRMSGEPVRIRIFRTRLGSAEAASAFVDHLRAGRSLLHPNILRFVDAGSVRGFAYVAHEWIAGAEPVGPACDVATVARRFGSVGRAVEDAHRLGLLHLGLRPSRCLVDRSTGEVHLDGFGVRAAMEAIGLPAIAPGADTSSFPFLAPEQLLDPGSVDERTDVYGLGALLFALLADRPPFESPNPMHLMNAVLAEPPIDLAIARPDAPPAVGAVVERALAKDPADRFPSSASLVDAFEAAVRGA